ncbi:unnamed protein product [Mortierella alpina]
MGVVSDTEIHCSDLAQVLGEQCFRRRDSLQLLDETVVDVEIHPEPGLELTRPVFAHEGALGEIGCLYMGGQQTEEFRNGKEGVGSAFGHRGGMTEVEGNEERGKVNEG